MPGDDDTPLDVQAADAEVAVDFLQSKIDGPVGLFGFSQGAWSASLAASRDQNVAFLAVVGCSGVSPAEQMWFYSDELMRRAGYGPQDRASQLKLRRSMDDLYRGAGDRDQAQRLLEELVGEPWFDTAFPVTELPGPNERWSDIDYDPEPAFARVTVPTLLMYGSDEECVPPAPSKDAWRRAASVSGNERVTTIDIPGCGHFPAPGESAADLAVPVSAFSAAYGSALTDWLADLDLPRHDEN
jgi:pimeloyl-ACP methyl ester carboxylesterase